MKRGFISLRSGVAVGGAGGAISSIRQECDITHTNTPVAGPASWWHRAGPNQLHVSCCLSVQLCLTDAAAFAGMNITRNMTDLNHSADVVRVWKPSGSVFQRCDRRRRCVATVEPSSYKLVAIAPKHRLVFTQSDASANDQAAMAFDSFAAQFDGRRTARVHESSRPSILPSVARTACTVVSSRRASPPTVSPNVQVLQQGAAQIPTACA